MRVQWTRGAVSDHDAPREEELLPQLLALLTLRRLQRLALALLLRAQRPHLLAPPPQDVVVVARELVVAEFEGRGGSGAAAAAAAAAAATAAATAAAASLQDRVELSAKTMYPRVAVPSEPPRL